MARRPHRRTRQPSVPGLRSSNPELLPCKALGVDDDLPQLAIEALDRVLGDDSEWRSLWGEAGASEFPQINKLRAVLSGPPELPGQIAML